MTTAIKKLIECIDQLALWLKENPKTPMPSQHRQKAIVILNKIMDAEEINDDEWNKLKSKTSKQIASQKNPPSSSQYAICKDCGVKLNVKNVENHKRKCKSKKTI